MTRPGSTRWRWTPFVSSVIPGASPVRSPISVPSHVNMATGRELRNVTARRSARFCVSVTAGVWRACSSRWPYWPARRGLLNAHSSSRARRQRFGRSSGSRVRSPIRASSPRGSKRLARRWNRAQRRKRCAAGPAGDYVMQLGIVGLPFSGKSTLFQAITKTHLDAAAMAKPDAHLGVVKVPDERLDRCSALFSPKSTVYASIEFVDVAGLQKGASGTAQFSTSFLSAVKNNDALIQVVRLFGDDIDPLRDVATFETEFILAD